MAKGSIGTVVQVIGPVLDIRFKDGELPQLLNAVEVESGEKKLTVEVAQHIGDDVVRCIAMSSTDGLTRGAILATKWNPMKIPTPIGGWIPWWVPPAVCRSSTAI